MVGGSLVQAFPIGKTRATILERIPLLADWAKSPYRWGDLQYLESEVIMRTVETLAFTHGVPCLPVHDSVIVPAANQALASKVLSDAFRLIVGVVPHMKVA